MLPLLIGGVALAATGYGIKKYFESDENCEKAQETLLKGCEWLDEVSEKSDRFFDGVNKRIENYFSSDEEEIILKSEDSFELITKVSECVEYYEKTRNKLSSSVLKELYTALHQIENLNQKISSNRSYDNTSKKIIINDNIKEVFYQFGSIFQSINIYLYVELKKLDKLLLKSKDFTYYNYTEQEFVQKLINLHEDTLQAMKSAITLDGETVNERTTRDFEKLRKYETED